MKTVVFVTHNNGKFREAKEKFRSIGVELRQYSGGYPEIQADTLEEVALYGVEYLSDKLSEPFFLEDAGLFVDALKGFPGVYSAYVFRSIGCDGILKLLENVVDRSAEFRSVVAYKEPGGEPVVFRGVCRCEISYEKKGSNGFGYDPIFVPVGSNLTFGEMDVKEKNSFSHRGKSLQKLLEYMRRVMGKD
ncbi:MAG: non-canonical purine NTP pyrophosphatase, RdgB/HAM1 family [Thermoplasmata archaeon]|nr:MAG: non-canonical purine NTP pyrophosphatase, RdgB/HAM1 family [Thermoplasmata archaeon]